jgi:hypothetical protein
MKSIQEMRAAVETAVTGSGWKQKLLINRRWTVKLLQLTGLGILLAVALLAVPLAASAQYMDVELDPAEKLADLIAFFENCVTDRTVVGSGPGNSAANRLQAFGNMLDEASDLIAVDNYDFACDHLQSASQKSDGQPPPDFIEGENVEAINDRIEEVMDILRCFE